MRFSQAIGSGLPLHTRGDQSGRGYPHDELHARGSADDVHGSEGQCQYLNTFEYDPVGRLVRDTNAGNGGWTLAHTAQGQDTTVSMTTAEGRTVSFKVDPLTTGDRQQVNTYPDGTVQTKHFKTNGEETTTAPDGTLTSVHEGPDPRFGMQAPVAGTASIRLPSGLTSQITTTRTAALSVPTDPFRFTSLTETTTVNGKAYTSAFDKATLTYTNTSPAGRLATTLINDQHRPQCAS